MGSTTADRPPRTPARQRLLDAADELFYTRGINATGVDAVIEAASVARMTFYHHFRGKDDLITTYLERRDARWRKTLEDVITAAGSDPEARLLAVFDALRLWHDDRGHRGCSFVNAAAELSDVEHPARMVITAQRAALRERLRDLATETGDQDPAVLADRLMLLYDGALIAGALGPTADAIATARSIAQSLLARGSGDTPAPL